MQLAHKLAYVCENIRSDGVNATEFIPLAQKFNVSSVPKIVVNEKVEFVGALPEDAFIDQVLAAISIGGGTDKK